MIKIIIKCPVFHKDNLEEQHIGSLRTYHHGYLNSTLMWREEVVRLGVFIYIHRVGQGPGTTRNAGNM